MKNNPNSKPFVTLIIPMRNEADYINGCLESLSKQDYPKDKLEIMVFDGASTDDSWKIAAQYANLFEHFKLLANQKIIQSAAWNTGIGLAQGSVVGIVSAHAELASDYVSQAIETLLRTQVDMVGGPTRTSASGGVAGAIAIAMSTPFGVGGANFHYTEREIQTDAVFMGICWRSLFEKIGGFDEEMVRDQDDEFNYRLREHGGKIVCNPAIKSSYYSRSTFRGLWKQYYQYGYYKIRVLQKHPRQMRPRQFAPFAFVGSILISIILSGIFNWGWIFLATVLGSYFLVNFLSSLWVASQKGWRYFPYLPICFVILHTSYGLGFLMGLIKFWNRWGDKKGEVPVFKAIDA